MSIDLSTAPYDPSIISFGKLIKCKKGGDVINVNNALTKKTLKLKFPSRMWCWGAQEGLDSKKKSTGKYTISLQFAEESKRSVEEQNAIDWLHAHFNHIRDYLQTNSVDIFGKSCSMEVIDDKFSTPLLRHPYITGTKIRDTSKPPSMVVKLNKVKERWATNIFSEEGELVYKDNGSNDDDLLDYLRNDEGEKGYNITCCGDSAGIWITNGKVSATTQLTQVIVYKNGSNNNDECLLVTKPSSSVPVASASVTNSNKVSVEVIESDDEKEEEKEEKSIPIERQEPIEPAVNTVEEVEEEKEPVVAPVVVTKPTVKKTAVKKTVK